MTDVSRLATGILYPLAESGLASVSKVEVSAKSLDVLLKPIRPEVIKEDEHYNTDATVSLKLDFTAPTQGVLVTIKTKSNLQGHYFAPSMNKLVDFLTILTNAGVTLKGQRVGEEFKVRVSQIDISLREQSLLLIKLIQVQEDFKAHINSEGKVVVTVL